VAAAEAAVPDALALLRQLVERNSGTLNLAGVRAVGALLAPRFEELGLRTRWVDGTAFGRAGHLVARRRGADARLSVLFIGHLDTVFDADSPFQHFTVLADSTATGPGVADMKGGDVIMLVVLRALAAAGALDRLDVRVVLDGDEEQAGVPRELARRDLVEAARGCDVVFGFEDGAGDPAQAVVARRGSASWTLRVSGRRAHSSQVFREGVGYGAVFEAARILEAFRDSLGHEPHLTFNPGLVLGGSEVVSEPGGVRGTASGKTNVVPETTLVRGDLRALTPAQFTHAMDVMTRIVGRHLPGTDADIAFDDGYPPLAPAPGHDALLAEFDRASRDLGFGPVTATAPDDAGAADISFVGDLVPMALDGVGLAGSGGHTVHEQAGLRVLAENAERVALTLLRLSERSRPPRALTGPR
jgi:glutamate carboxypeptidase